MIPIKNTYEIEQMRAACKVAAEVLELMCQEVKPGVTTYDLDQLAKELIEKFGATSACYNYKAGSRRFPAYSCISVNEEVVHGIGSMKRVLQEGDIVTCDVSLKYNGFVGDNARTVMLDPVEGDYQKMVKATEQALYDGIEAAVAGNRVGDISATIQESVESAGFAIVRDFVGHGIGRSIHEEPQIPNFGRKGTGPKLKPGMTLAIEPMVNYGSHEVEYAQDGWTALTVDRKPAAHFEHTVLITEKKPEILTFFEK